MHCAWWHRTLCYTACDTIRLLHCIQSETEVVSSLHICRWTVSRWSRTEYKWYKIRRPRKTGSRKRGRNIFEYKDTLHIFQVLWYLDLCVSWMWCNNTFCRAIMQPHSWKYICIVAYIWNWQNDIFICHMHSRTSDSQTRRCIICKMVGMCLCSTVVQSHRAF